MSVSCREAARIAQEEAARSAPQRIAPPAKPPAKAVTREEKAALEREKQAARNWILQYAEEERDSDDEDNQVRQQARE